MVTKIILKIILNLFGEFKSIGFSMVSGSTMTEKYF
jgi:hypothetical protein